jgi:hypothetical protein
MNLMPQLLAAAGWTDFSGVFSTVFPLLVLIAVLACFAVVVRKRS